MFGNGKQEQDLIEMRILYIVRWISFNNKIQTKENIDVKGEGSLSQVSKIICNPFNSSSWSCSINTNRTGILSLLLLWFVSAQQAPLPVPANHFGTRLGISLCSLLILSLPERGLFPFSWYDADTGLLHLALVL